MSPPDRRARGGAAYALAAYLAWGVVPLFWKELRHVPAVEVVAHRVVWALSFLLLLSWARGFGQTRRLLRDGRALAAFGAASALIAFNWGTYIYAVLSDRIVEASLGYFVTPLVNVLLGLVVLRERLRRIQWLAVALAAAGAAQLGLGAPQLPWLASALAVSFGLYGLVRKTAPAEPLDGSLVETALVAPVALAYLGWLASDGSGHFAADARTSGFLLAAGPVTALPLLWFSNAARRLPLSTLGFFQYVSPSLQLALAVGLYGEPFGARELRAFACIWAALALLAFETRFRG
jgi:chloramphenicol-sensitive protein RarD